MNASAQRQKYVTWDDLIDEIIDWPRGRGLMPGMVVPPLSAKLAIQVATACRSRRIVVPNLCYPSDDGECWFDWVMPSLTCTVVCQASGRITQGREYRDGKMEWVAWNPRLFGSWMKKAGGR